MSSDRITGEDGRTLARRPNEREIDALIKWLKDQGHDAGEAIGLIDRARIVTFPHYIPDGPGYTGSVVSVIWPAGPETSSVFTVHPGDAEGLIRLEEAGS